MKLLIAIQARSNSTRLPKKIYEKIGERSLLEWIYTTADLASKQLNKEGFQSEVKVIGIYGDDQLEKYCEEKKINSQLFLLDQDDLMFRYSRAAIGYDAIIRLTSDCWCQMPELILMTAHGLKAGADYVCNTIFRTFPEGYDIQGCSSKALEWFNLTQVKDREHPFYTFDMNLDVRKQFENEGMKYAELTNPDFSFLRKGFSIDTQQDLEEARKTYEKSQKTRRLVVEPTEKHHGSIQNRNNF